MEKIEIKLIDKCYYFTKYGRRMYQEAQVFLNDVKLESYDVAINYYIDKELHLEDYISIDHYNNNETLKNRGLGLKIFDELIKYYNNAGFNKFALIIAKPKDKPTVNQLVMKKIASKLGFEFNSTMEYYYPEDRKNGNFEVFFKSFENEKSANSDKTNGDKQDCFRKLKNNSIIFNMEFRQNKIKAQEEQTY